MQQPGPKSWHPNPAFLFQRGAGPLFDIGPYYITALIQLFGAVRKVSAISGKARAARVVGSGPRAGETFTVDVPTHISAGLGFADGRSATSIYSFDSPLKRTLFELTGTEATLAVPDPNDFGGDLLIRSCDDEDWRILNSTQTISGRGTGVLDLARAIREDRPHRASGAVAAHVLDIMVGAIEAAEHHQVVTLTSNVEPAEPLPDDWDSHLPTR
jgi:predicted dehydrogenase